MVLKQFFSARAMIPQHRICGEIPSSSTAYRTAFAMAWPSAMESFLVALVGVVDTIMVGELGPEAISAVGITNQPKLIVLAVILSLNVGITAITARRKGENDPDSANHCLRQGIILSALLALVLGTLAFIYAPWLMDFSGAGNDILADSVLYFRIILVGNFFYSVSLTINAAQRGVGNTKISMVTNMTANLVNLVFNYLLINGRFGFPRWGVAGAAVATALGNLIAFLLSVHSILVPGHFLCLKRTDSWRFDMDTVRHILPIAAGAGTEQLITRFGLFFYAKILAGLGTMAFAASQIVINMQSISFSFGEGLGFSSAALVGQNLGADRPDLSIMYGKVSQRIGLVISCFLCTMFIIFRHPIVAIFNDNPEVLALAAPLMVITGIICIPNVSGHLFAGSLRGAGDVRYVAFVSFVSLGIIRPFLSWILCYPLGLGLIGAWYGLLADQMCRFLLYMHRFYSGKWTEIKV